ncbi:hypothetical protein SARC_06690 [Sphaeroforma arctica JP610]|uniref:Core domain-containing protein n=1 Tax=Sphaeroforma arctica JP610 TaxID=667725 RepID=A0A0L0FYB5_9EUKA|nr:hypothetical protein SARC_06690 [Sphaeroforma arctica JP610]KNC80958.1 hypothetical protein SARC_06690 [Sphaeroforma arctica JP610]|eukprot:XP_014154860.1 hypothetical protein SARC_06690 [Sphaeroforma arctica JP610]
MFRISRTILNVDANALALVARVRRATIGRSTICALQSQQGHRSIYTTATTLHSGNSDSKVHMANRLSLVPSLCKNIRLYSNAVESAEEEIIISESAAKRLNLLQEDDKDLILRVEVDGGGCQGFQYNLKLETMADIDPEEDRVYKRDGATVVVDESSLETLKGSTIDYKSSLIGSAFCVGENPLADATCGCNRSFNIK